MTIHVFYTICSRKMKIFLNPRSNPTHPSPVLVEVSLFWWIQPIILEQEQVENWPVLRFEFHLPVQLHFEVNFFDNYWSLTTIGQIIIIIIRYSFYSSNIINNISTIKLISIMNITTIITIYSITIIIWNYNVIFIINYVTFFIININSRINCTSYFGVSFLLLTNRKRFISFSSNCHDHKFWRDKNKISYDRDVKKR